MRIAHLSDLHFGHHDPKLAEDLAGDIAQQQPTLVVISGDFTQRGTREEFAQARKFLDSLTSPVFAVPGNHDVPALNIVRRMLAPYRLYKTYISDALEPLVEIDGVAIAGLKTARRARLEFNWAHGTISRWQLKDLAKTFSRASPESMRIVVAHHPLLLPEDAADEKMRPARKSTGALAAFHELGVRAVLSGHFHLSYVREHSQELVTDVPAGGRTRGGAPILVIQASTTISTRLRGEPNAYNLVDIDAGSISVLVRERLGGKWVTRERASARS